MKLDFGDPLRFRLTLELEIDEPNQLGVKVGNQWLHMYLLQQLPPEIQHCKIVKVGCETVRD